MMTRDYTQRQRSINNSAAFYKMIINISEIKTLFYKTQENKKGSGATVPEPFSPEP
tara:strand:- start:623 stop:790 length:168 start_codon:yes stop_codon:yes gene_type:complete